jgi:hypothetical protein
MEVERRLGLCEVAGFHAVERQHIVQDLCRQLPLIR